MDAWTNLSGAGDITNIATWEGWLYLATVTGIASRRVLVVVIRAG